jgi:hypothetical protein
VPDSMSTVSMTLLGFTPDYDAVVEVLPAS